MLVTNNGQLSALYPDYQCPDFRSGPCTHPDVSLFRLALDSDQMSEEQRWPGKATPGNQGWALCVVRQANGARPGPTMPAAAQAVASRIASPVSLPGPLNPHAPTFMPTALPLPSQAPAAQSATTPLCSSLAPAGSQPDQSSSTILPASSPTHFPELSQCSLTPRGGGCGPHEGRRPLRSPAEVTYPHESGRGGAWGRTGVGVGLGAEMLASGRGGAGGPGHAILEQGWPPRGEASSRPAGSVLGASSPDEAQRRSSSWEAASSFATGVGLRAPV